LLRFQTWNLFSVISCQHRRRSQIGGSRAKLYQHRSTASQSGPPLCDGVGKFWFPDLFVAGLQIWATNPAQLDTPSMTIEGGWEFDSTYDVAFSAFAGIGTGPTVPVMGTGTARAKGAAAQDGFIFEPRVYQTEMLMLNLQGQVFSQPFMIRESPTLASRGVSTTQDTCPQCDPVFVRYRITSFFDVFTELSINGGETWVPSPSSVRIIQTPEPEGLLLLVCGVGFGVPALGRGRRR
jgi:hypothetical protein